VVRIYIDTQGAIAPWATRGRAEGELPTLWQGAPRRFLDGPWKSSARQAIYKFGLGGRKIAVKWGKEGTEPRHLGDALSGRDPTLREIPADGIGVAREQYRKFMSEQPC